ASAPTGRVAPPPHAPDARLRLGAGGARRRSAFGADRADRAHRAPPGPTTPALDRQRTAPINRRRRPGGSRPPRTARTHDSGSGPAAHGADQPSAPTGRIAPTAHRPDPRLRLWTGSARRRSTFGADRADRAHRAPPGPTTPALDRQRTAPINLRRRPGGSRPPRTARTHDSGSG